MPPGGAGADGVGAIIAGIDGATADIIAIGAGVDGIGTGVGIGAGIAPMAGALLAPAFAWYTLLWPARWSSMS